MLPESVLLCLGAFEGCFTAPSHRRFLTLMTGWLLCVGKHTVTGVMRAAGVSECREHSGYHRFFSRGAWSPDEIGLRLATMVFARTGSTVLSLDDTLARHTGKHIASAGMHRDPLLSCASRPFLHFGHNWIVLATVVEMPWGKRYSLPLLVRLYRTEKVNKKLGRVHRKKTELGLEMLQALSRSHPERDFVVVTDNAYVNRSVIRPLPTNVHLVGRGRMDAAVYAPPPAYGGRGRPRVRGRRLSSPKQRADRGRWRTVEAAVYGRPSLVRVQVFDALWYIVGRERVLRLVVIRGWPGHDKDDVLVTTDLTMTANRAIELYCQRWTLEETFGWVKSRLGFEDPCNRTEHAVQRTAPMALWSYTLVVHWYGRWCRRRLQLPMRPAPWQRRKTSPSFADMLATLRRQSWTLWVCDQARRGRLDQKSLAPLLDIAGYG